MTWNVENLFRPAGDASAEDATAYQSKLAGLADRINFIAPHALALQEVGSDDLDDLVPLLNGVWNVQISTHPDARGIRVAG
jgi:hypothetical protein